MFGVFLDKICFIILIIYIVMEWSDFCKYDGRMNHGPYLLRMILGDLKINTKSSFYEDESASHSR